MLFVTRQEQVNVAHCAHPALTLEVESVLDEGLGLHKVQKLAISELLLNTAETPKFLCVPAHTRISPQFSVGEQTG